ncbi:hypothetical protein JHK85_041517 [Glycine max]|nr:hypothetical protein JHK85_041517 [Glycine max]
MDPPIKKKTLSRASLSPQRKDKCIVFPLVRYNEFREPVCQACNVVMLESIRAHLASPEHNEPWLKYKKFEKPFPKFLALPNTPFIKTGMSPDPPSGALGVYRNQRRIE